MKETVEPGKIADKLSNYFKKAKHVEAVYLFGSQASQKSSPRSDIDIGVILGRKFPEENYFEARLKWMGELSSLLNREADVVIVNEASSVLAYQVLRYGRRIYERFHRDHSVEVKALMEYFDFLPYRRRCEQAMVEHIRRAS